MVSMMLQTLFFATLAFRSDVHAEYDNNVVATELRYEKHYFAQLDDVRQAECHFAASSFDYLMRSMTYDIGHGRDRACVFLETKNPSVLRQTLGTMKENESDEDDSLAVVDTRPTTFGGPSPPPLLCKFHNLSNQTLMLIWQKGPTDFELIKKMQPMTASGTTCEVSQVFLFLDLENPQEPLTTFHVMNDVGSLFVYDAFSNVLTGTRARNSAYQPDVLALTPTMWNRYRLYKDTLAFARLYQATTGNPYFSHHGREPPIHPLWPADFVGQQHSLAGIPAAPTPSGASLVGMDSADEVGSHKIFTWTVISAAPRVLEMENFLSPDEVRALREQANKLFLPQSETGQGFLHRRYTRTSRNAWIQPDDSILVQTIYRRIAYVLGIPYETAFRQSAEALQVIHYREGEEYKAHYDFGFPPIDNPKQPTRFATLLVYLNGGDGDLEGGQTSFPRAAVPVNATRSENGNDDLLQVEPVAGKAVLFYSLLPDGNTDHRSLHAALPVVKGSKWLANVWIWDPILELESHL